MSSLEMGINPGERKLETAFLFAVTAPNDWAVHRGHCLDIKNLKVNKERGTRKGQK